MLDSGERNDDCGRSESADESAQSSKPNGQDDDEADETALNVASAITGKEGKEFNLYISVCVQCMCSFHKVKCYILLV